MIVCIFRRQAEIISRLAPELVGKLRGIYSPLPDIPPIKKSLGDPILYSGGDSCVKGFAFFLRASQEVLKRNLNVKFLLARGFKDVSRLIFEKLNRSFKRAYSLFTNQHSYKLNTC